MKRIDKRILSRRTAPLVLAGAMVTHAGRVLEVRYTFDIPWPRVCCGRIEASVRHATRSALNHELV
jgi:hypothetical protein